MGIERPRISTAERALDQVPVLALLEREFDQVPVLALLEREFDRVPVLEPELDRVPVLVLREPALDLVPVLGLLAAEIASVAATCRQAAAVMPLEVAGSVEALLGPAAAGEAILWAAAVSAAAAAAAAEGVAEEDARDEQFSDGTKTYEIEIQPHEASKNFFGRLCDRLVRFGRVCVAGRAGKNQAECDGRF